MYKVKSTKNLVSKTGEKFSETKVVFKFHGDCHSKRTYKEIEKIVNPSPLSKELLNYFEKKENVKFYEEGRIPGSYLLRNKDKEFYVRLHWLSLNMGFTMQIKAPYGRSLEEICNLEALNDFVINGTE